MFSTDVSNMSYFVPQITILCKIPALNIVLLILIWPQAEIWIYKVYTEPQQNI